MCLFTLVLPQRAFVTKHRNNFTSVYKYWKGRVHLCNSFLTGNSLDGKSQYLPPTKNKYNINMISESYLLYSHKHTHTHWHGHTHTCTGADTIAFKDSETPQLQAYAVECAWSEVRSCLWLWDRTQVMSPPCTNSAKQHPWQKGDYEHQIEQCPISQCFSDSKVHTHHLGLWIWWGFMF